MKKFPFSVIFSGILNWLLTGIVAGAVGILFFVFGLIASYNLFKIIGLIAIAFYIVISIVNPIRSLLQETKELSDAELDAIIEDTLKNRSMRDYFKGVMTAADERLQMRYSDYEEDDEAEENLEDE